MKQRFCDSGTVKLEQLSIKTWAIQFLATYMYIIMRLGNCLGSCDRYLKCHSARAVSYKASKKLGNLMDYRVIGFSAIVPVNNNNNIIIIIIIIIRIIILIIIILI